MSDATDFSPQVQHALELLEETLMDLRHWVGVALDKGLPSPAAEGEMGQLRDALEQLMILAGAGDE